MAPTVKQEVVSPLAPSVRSLPVMASVSRTRSPAPVDRYRDRRQVNYGPPLIDPPRIEPAGRGRTPPPRGRTPPPRGRTPPPRSRTPPPHRSRTPNPGACTTAKMRPQGSLAPFRSTTPSRHEPPQPKRRGRPRRTPAPESRSPTPNLNRPLRKCRQISESRTPVTKRKKIIETSESEGEEDVFSEQGPSARSNQLYNLALERLYNLALEVDELARKKREAEEGLRSITAEHDMKVSLITLLLKGNGQPDRW
uniref:ENT domain-containing protein n=1 Tax=Steinernema glaseri TaxID=37863 RepID=A0A1I7Z5S0_9BILA